MSGMPMHPHNVCVLSVSQTEVVFHTYMYHVHVSCYAGRMGYSCGKLLVTERFHLKESLRKSLLNVLRKDNCYM